MRLKSDFLLLVVTLLWGSAFAVMRAAAEANILYLLNGSRFLVGGLLLFPFSKIKVAVTRKNIHYVILAGLALFFAATFQQMGLRTSSAGNGGFITILYVVLVPFILWIGWKERPTTRIWIAVILAGFGGFLLSTNGTMTIARGDLLILIGSFFWALHVVIVGGAQGMITPLAFAAGQFLLCGSLNLMIGLISERPSVDAYISILPAILYTAVFSIAIGFTLQVIAQKHTPASEAALILSLEAVFAALFGGIFLKETLTAIQISGCLLIAVAVCVVQIDNGKMRERKNI